MTSLLRRCVTCGALLAMAFMVPSISLEHDSRASQAGPSAKVGEVSWFTSGERMVQGVKAMTLGADGMLWFTDSVSYAVGTVDPSGEVSIVAETREAVFRDGARRPWNLAAGPRGLMWVQLIGLQMSDRLARFTPDGQVSLVNLPGFQGDAMSAGPDGSVWLTGSRSSRKGMFLAHVTPQGDVRFVRISPPTGLIQGWDPRWAATSLSVASDGAIWVGVVSQFLPVVGTYLAGALPVLVTFIDSLLSRISSSLRIDAASARLGMPRSTTLLVSALDSAMNSAAWASSTGAVRRCNRFIRPETSCSSSTWSKLGSMAPGARP